MIDEDLYKIATDELNSDARKPDVWARACALASDDHDEARFLYTNLRVEEMLNKDGKQRTFSTNNQLRNSDFNSSSSADATELKRVASSGSDGLESTTRSMDSNIAPIESSRAGVDSRTTPLPTEELDTFEMGDLDAPTSTAGTDTLSDKVVEFDEETMKEIAALSIENSNDSSTVSNIAGKPANASQLNEDSHDNTDLVTKVFGTSAAANRKQILSDTTENTFTSADDLTLANDLDHETRDEIAANAATPQSQPSANDKLGQQPAGENVGMPQVGTPRYDEPDTLPDSIDNDATAESTRADLDYARAGVAESGQQQYPNVGENSDYSDTEHLMEEDETFEITSDLDSGVGRSFMVFNQHGTLKAVKRGVSWPALFFTFPWLLSKTLFGTAIAYGCLWLVSLGGLLLSASQWMNAGADATTNIKLWTCAFALLSIIGLLYIPFRYGNRWVVDKLQNRGYRYEGSVSAENKLDAVGRLIRYNQRNA